MKDAVANWTGIMGIVARSQSYDVDTSTLSACDDVGTQASLQEVTVPPRGGTFILR